MAELDARLIDASGGPEAFQIVYSALMTLYESSCRVGHMTQFADEVAAVAVRALRAAGYGEPAPVVVPHQTTKEAS